MGRRHTMPCKNCGEVGGARFRLKSGRDVRHGWCVRCTQIAHTLFDVYDKPLTITMTHEQLIHENGYPFVRRVK